MLRTAPCPALTVRHPDGAAERAPDFEMEQIVAPVDFSDLSRAALKYVFQLAPLYGIPVKLMHVVEDPTLPPIYEAKSTKVQARAAASRRPRSTCATSTPQFWRRAWAMSLADMAQSSGLSYDRLRWTTRWYVREDALTAATDDLVDFQYEQPLAKRWGGGTLSSSDGQRVSVSGKVLWRQGPAAPPRLRPRHHLLHVDILHVDLGSALAVWHEGNLHDRTGRDLRPRRDPRQRNRADDLRAYHLSLTATPISRSDSSIFSECASLRASETLAPTGSIGCETTSSATPVSKVA